MVPDVRIFLIWTGTYVFLQVDHVNAAECVFPFTYGGIKYFDCSTQGSMYNWCSLDEEFSGKWKYCTKDDFAKCVFPFIYDGKSYDECTTDGSLIRRSWCALTANYDEDKAWKRCY